MRHENGWRILVLFLTLFALLVVSTGIGYHDYNAIFWICVGWLAMDVLSLLAGKRHLGDHKRRSRR
jgi:hypothetical protein